MGNPLLPQAVNKVHDRKLRHVAIFRREWWKEGDFFFHEERGRVISLCDTMMWVLDNFSPTLMDCLIWLYLCIYLSLFSYSSVKYHSTLTQSIGSWCILAGSRVRTLPLPPPSPPSPRLLLRFTEAPDIWRCMLICKDVFWVVCYFILLLRYLLVKAPICLTTVRLMKLIYLPVLILNKCLNAKTLRSLNSWWTLSAHRSTALILTEKPAWE